MAAAKTMTRIANDNVSESVGAVYEAVISVLDQATSDFYIIPTQAIYAILHRITGTGKIYYCNDSKAVIEAGNAVWVEWTSGLVNLAVTGFKVASTSGVVSATVVVKTINT